MRQMRLATLGLLALAAVALAGLLAVDTDAGGRPMRGGFLALTGSEASSFQVPQDMRLVTSFDLEENGLTYERYQQYRGAAQVLGGQISMYRDGSGEIAAVIGYRYPGLSPANAVALSAAAAERIAELDIGPAEQRSSDLMIDPGTGRRFFRVESRGFASRWFHWVDAASGEVLNSYNALETGEGIGTKGDTKDLTGMTTFSGVADHGAAGPHFDLFSTDDRQQTFDYRNRNPFIYFVTDSDDTWDVFTSNRRSPGHPALIDAQYYANVTDDYLQSVHGLDWTTDCGYTAMLSVAHFDRDYNNAFWDGTYTVYGDGDGVNRREFSGALDVVAHEHAHGVTDCTSDLIYQDESGALNESFSDIVGNSAEFFANEPDSSNCAKALGQTACADWWIAEDIVLASDDVPGFRNMADPEEDNDPDHYSEYIVTSQDNGGVHSNSAIPNHAYYLLVNGGLNASCAEPTTHDSDHCTDGDTQDNNLNVSGIGLADTEQIFFLGVTALSSVASICDARASTEAFAISLFGPSSQQALSTTDAWLAVGLTDLACGVVDSDGDGVPDASDNCPAWPNAGQSLPPWPVPVGDEDCDGWTTSDENSVGTLPMTACPATSAARDEDPDAWIPDFDDSQAVNIADLLGDPNSFKNSIGATDPGPLYFPRFDLNMDGTININDLLGSPNSFKSMFGLSCT